VDLPEWLQGLIANLGLDVALDITELMTRKWTPQYFYDELQGISDASGIEYQTLVRIHMLAGLTQGACSMVLFESPKLSNISITYRSTDP
jgi:hypothetical protein